MEELRDEVLGVPLPVAARVVNVSTRQLRRWSDRGLIVPSLRERVGRRHAWAYTLDELVSASIVRQLERQVPLRQIEGMIDEALANGHTQPFMTLRWAVGHREVFAQYPDGSWYGGRKPNQGTLREMLGLVEIRARVRRELQRPRSAAGRIERRRGVHASAAVFADSRVPVATVRRYLEHGFTDDRILTSFPALYPEDIDAARQLMAS